VAFKEGVQEILDAIQHGETVILNAAKATLRSGLILRSILPERSILGDALLAAFARALGEQDLSPVTARGYLHDLHKWREWLESSGGKPRDLESSRNSGVQALTY
jgi:hypothetical protein